MPASVSASVPEEAVRRILAECPLTLHGRIMPASNATFFATAVGLGLNGEEVGVPCVYKPVAGERPLWDFPDGTLAARERAAYLVSRALGWDVVPLTLLREGPHGPGMVQVWCEPDEEVQPVDLCPSDAAPPGYLHVLDASDGDGQQVSLVHSDDVALRRMAIFDVLVNNADRKGGHVLAMADGHRYGVDHGVCFHVDPKLRTVLWGWAGERLTAAERAEVAAFTARLQDDATLADGLAELLTRAEVSALVRRAAALVRSQRLPVPSGSWPSIPWPAF